MARCDCVISPKELFCAVPTERSIQMKPSRISRLYRVPTASRFFPFVAIQQLFAPATSPPGGA